MAKENRLANLTSAMVHYRHPSAIAGWTALEKEEQFAVVRETEAIAGTRVERGMATLREGDHLRIIRSILEPKRIFVNYLEQYYPTSIKTAYRYMEMSEAFEKQYSRPVLEGIMMQAPQIMDGVGPKEFLSAAKGLPVPKTPDPKTIEGYCGKVAENNRKLRVERRKRSATLDQEMALKECFNYILNAMDKCKWKSTADKGDWLERLLGILSSTQALPGTRTLKRIEAPAGFRVRPGRPRKKIPAEKA